MSKLINSHNGFDPLEEVWLGGTYPSEFYEHLDGPVRDAFQTITEWTNEDLNKIHKALEEHGITVERPEYGSIDDCINDNSNLYKPVVAPRDETIVIGNTMYHLRNNFKKNPNKLNYTYLLTPKGIATKTKLTLNFMKKKLIEYDELKSEIENDKK